MKTPRDDADPNNDGMERIRMAAAGPTVKIESSLPLRKWLYS